VPKFKRGDIVKCIEAPDYLRREVSLGTLYVVNKLTQSGAYIRILGDDNQGHDLLHSMFAPA
jgi:hypothetical protein